MSYLNLSFSSDVKLSWQIPYTSGSVICDINDFSAQQEGLKVFLPSAIYGSLGNRFFISNTGDYTFSLYAGSSLIQEFLLGQSFFLYQTNILTAEGGWKSVPLNSQGGGISFLKVESSDGGISVEGSPVNTSAGSLDLNIPLSLSDLAKQEISGVVLASFSNNLLTLAPIPLSSDSNIGITKDNTLNFSLNSALSSITSLSTAGLKIEGLDISSISNDTSITLNKVSVDNDGNVNVPGSLETVQSLEVGGSLNVAGSVNITGDIKSSSGVTCYVRFSDNGLTPPGNIIIQSSSTNLLSVAGSQGLYVITFVPETFTNSGYSVFPSVQKQSDSNFVREAFYQSTQINYCTIYTVDGQGNLTPAIDSVSVLCKGK